MTARRFGGLAIVLSGCLVLLALAAGCSDKEQRKFRAAYRLQSEGKSELAIAEYERLVADAPNHPIAAWAHYQLAYLYRMHAESPDQALAQYQIIADRHPKSVFADDALLWIASLGRAKQDVQLARSAVERLETNYPQQTSECARARIQLALVLLDAGDLEAKTVCESVLKLYPDQPSQCAQAQLVLARAIEKLDKDSDKAVAELEKVMAKYPDTTSAVEARQQLGWIFFDATKTRPKRKPDEAAATKPQAKRVKGVTAFAQGPQLGIQALTLEALAALLRQQQVETDLDTLMAVSGAAFQFVYDRDNRGIGAAVFATNPFETAAHAYGFNPLKGSSGSAEEAMLSLCQMIDRGKPVLVPYSEHGWVVVVGYDQAQRHLMYLQPGATEEAAEEFETFASRWKAAGDQVGGEMSSFYQFALGPRPSQPSAADLTRGAAKRGASLLRRTTVFGAPAGLAAYEELAVDLEAHAAGGVPDDAEDLAAWAEEPLSVLHAARGAAERFLRGRADALPEPMSSHARAASDGYRALQAKLDELRKAFPRPSAGREPGAPDPEYAAAAQTAAQLTREAMELDQRAAGHLLALAGE